MIRTCLNPSCGKEFEHPIRKGRPSGFCSNECRGAARSNPQRTCQNPNCSNTYFLSESPWPHHCSDACHNAQQNYCLNGCGTTTQPGDRFCSTACMAEHYGPRVCKRCGKPVTPTQTNLRTLPRYCDDECRYTTAAPTPWQLDQAARLSALLPETLPHDLPQGNGWYQPILVPHALAPKLPAKASARVVNSIAWWNHYLTDPEIPKVQVYIALLGMSGWGAPDSPTGCLPLFKCWPWITTAARRNIPDIQRLHSTWQRAGRAHPRTRAQSERIRSRLSQRVFNTSTYTPELIQEIKNYQDLLLPPPEARFLTPEEFQSISNEEYFTHKVKHERLRMSYTYPRNWGDDRPRIPDRTSAKFSEVLAEHMAQVEQREARR